MELMGIETGYNKLSAQSLPHRVLNETAGASPVNVGKWERIGSSLVGGYLVYRALKNRRWGSLLFGGTGLSLLNRGMSGVCPMYKRFGVSSTNI